MKNEFVQIQVTFGNREEAEKVARHLVERYLAACAQILGPITSFYHWKEELEVAEEWLLLAKTRSCLMDEVTEIITANHSYDLPQIIALPITEISPSYRGWLSDQIR